MSERAGESGLGGTGEGVRETGWRDRGGEGRATKAGKIKAGGEIKAQGETKERLEENKLSRSEEAGETRKDGSSPFIVNHPACRLPFTNKVLLAHSLVCSGHDYIACCPWQKTFSGLRVRSIEWLTLRPDKSQGQEVAAPQWPEVPLHPEPLVCTPPPTAVWLSWDG